MMSRQPQPLASFLPEHAQFLGASLEHRAAAKNQGTEGNQRTEGSHRAGENQKQTEVAGIAIDSRQVMPGDLFVARTGKVSRGRDHVQQAAEKGALAVLTDDPAVSEETLGLPVVFLEDLDGQISEIAGRFFGAPSDRLCVTGITGTNGKTTCCYWYSWLCNQLGKPCGQIGTLGVGSVSANKESLHSPSPLVSTGYTTPDAVTVQRLLAEIEASGAAAVAMEVSSHALDQGRVASVHFDTAIFTNLSQDHLDYHVDMERYFDAKSRLFQSADLSCAVLNVDDPTYSALKARLAPNTKCVGYSLQVSAADIYLEQKKWVEGGAHLTFAGEFGRSEAFVPIVGEYNLANLLAVMAALLASGVSLTDLVEMVSALPAVPGRLQRLSRPGVPTVIVDFAHTPDAVSKALQALRPSCSGRLIAIVGCGGNRDASKRPIMAQAAVRSANVCWFTSDNPRDEDPLIILKGMTDGLSEAERATVNVVVDRKQAIQHAVQSAHADDVVVILGKGHENYQEVNGQRHPHDDAVFAQQVLEALSDQGGAA